MFYWFQEVGLSTALSAAALELSFSFRFMIALPSKPAQLEEPPYLSAVQLIVPGSSFAQTQILIVALKNSGEEPQFQYPFLFSKPLSLFRASIFALNQCCSSALKDWFCWSSSSRFLGLGSTQTPRNAP